MLNSQELCEVFSLFLDKLTSFLIQNRLNLFYLSIIVDLDFVHLFIELILHLVLNLRIVNIPTSHGHYVSAHFR